MTTLWSPASGAATSARSRRCSPAIASSPVPSAHLLPRRSDKKSAWAIALQGDPGFDPARRPFRAFAELCITRQILTAIKTANRQKHQPLNSSVSLDAPAYGDDSGDSSVGDSLIAPSYIDPAEIVISAEEIEALRDSMRDNLTELEGDVLRLYWTQVLRRVAEYWATT